MNDMVPKGQSFFILSSSLFLPLFRSASAIGYRTFGANDMIRRRNKYIPVWRRILFFAVWVQQGQTVLLSLGLSVCWAHTATETKLALIDSRYRPFTWIDSSLSTFFQVFHWYILYRIRESSRYISSRVLTLIKFILAPSNSHGLKNWSRLIAGFLCFLSGVYLFLWSSCNGWCTWTVNQHRGNKIRLEASPLEQYTRHSRYIRSNQEKERQLVLICRSFSP